MRHLTRFDSAAAAGLMATAGIVDDSGNSYRADSDQPAAFARQLTHVIVKTYDTQYPDLRIRDFVPVSHEVPLGVQFFVTRSFDIAGMAELISSYSTNLPLVTLEGKERIFRTRDVGAAWDLTLADMRAAAFSGTPIDSKKALAARRMLENKLEILGAFGDAESGLEGFGNSQYIPILTSPGDITGSWLTATGEEIFDDLTAIANKLVTNSATIWKPDTLVLPPTRYALLLREMSIYKQSSILRRFLDSSPYIRSIEQWPLLETADSAGTGPRAICYAKNAEVVQLVIPGEFAQLPPQYVNLTTLFNCTMNLGGVVVHRPLGLLYVEGI